MTSVIILLLIIFFVLKSKNSNSRNNKREDLGRHVKETRRNNYSGASSGDYDSLEGSNAGETGVKLNNKDDFDRPPKPIKPKGNGIAHLRGLESHTYKLEDREHDWLARQLREEARMKRNIDNAMLNLKKEHLREHNKINYG